MLRLTPSRERWTPVLVLVTLSFAVVAAPASACSADFAGASDGVRVFYEDGLYGEYKLQMYHHTGAAPATITTVATSDAFFAGPAVDLRGEVVYFARLDSGTWQLASYAWASGAAQGRW